MVHGIGSSNFVDCSIAISIPRAALDIDSGYVVEWRVEKGGFLHPIGFVGDIPSPYTHGVLWCVENERVLYYARILMHSHPFRFDSICSTYNCNRPYA